MSNLRLCFAGTPAFAADHLGSLLRDNQNVVAVYTQPDRPSGRGKKLQASPVKLVAQQSGLNVLQPASLKTSESQQQLIDLAPDLLIVVAYGLILPQEILDIPKFGCINVHASLLPRWRGAAPIERALLAGDKETGVTLMQMDAGLDTGAMLHKETVAITDEDDRETLTEKLSIAGQKGLVYTLANLHDLQATAEIQDDNQSTYAAKIDKLESQIDWSQSAEQINRLVRAGIGRQPAYAFMDDVRLRLLVATVVREPVNKPPGTIVSTSKTDFLVTCGEGLLRVSRIQMPGKNPGDVRDFFNSNSELLNTGKQFSAFANT